MWCSETETDVGFCSGQCKICDKSKSIKQGECQMITQRTMDNKIQRTQEEISLAEKCIADLMQRKQELQELIDSLNAVEAERGRAAKGERYWYISDVGMLRFTTDERSDSDDYRYECGNYYLTEEDASRSKKQILLFRLLDRLSRQNGWTDELWEDLKIAKHYIYFDNSYKRIEINSVRTSRHTCQVYFPSVEIAQQAIEKYFDLIVEVMQI